MTQQNQSTRTSRWLTNNSQEINMSNKTGTGGRWGEDRQQLHYGHFISSHDLTFPQCLTFCVWFWFWIIYPVETFFDFSGILSDPENALPTFPLLPLALMIIIIIKRFLRTVKMQNVLSARKKIKCYINFFLFFCRKGPWRFLGSFRMN